MATCYLTRTSTTTTVEYKRSRPRRAAALRAPISYAEYDDADTASECSNEDEEVYIFEPDPYAPREIQAIGAFAKFFFPPYSRVLHPAKTLEAVGNAGEHQKEVKSVDFTPIFIVGGGDIVTEEVNEPGFFVEWAPKMHALPKETEAERELREHRAKHAMASDWRP